MRVSEGNHTLQLRDGSRVCIIGGGPAGSFAAMHLLKLAQEHGLQLDVLIFEARDHAQGLGRESCKGCAGILSASLVQRLEAFGIRIPPSVVQAELRAYVVHLFGQVTSIEQPDPRRRILSVYRGTGPRVHTHAPPSSFDGYLLSEACARGARHIPSRVRLVEWEDGPVVRTARESFPADLVVLATGVNSRHPLAPSFGYMPPRTEIMTQEEVARPDLWPSHKVAGFFGRPAGVAFGAMVPKGHYLNISLLVNRPAEDVIGLFYEDPDPVLQRFFPDPPPNLCGCTARINVGPARTYFGDRWVAVGDAAVSRLYKDGIHSAFLTAASAMRVAVESGIGARDFARGYAPFCRRTASDNWFGQALFKLALFAMRYSVNARACVQCIRAEMSLPVQDRTYSRLLWGMLTGDESYRDLAWLLVSPRGLLRFGREWARAAIDGLRPARPAEGRRP